MGRCIAESDLEQFHHGENVIPVAELIGIATMTSEWTVLIEVVRQWRWRCLENGTVVPGLELCVTNLGSGQRLPWQKAILTRCNGMTCVTTAAGVSHRSLL